MSIATVAERLKNKGIYLGYFFLEDGFDSKGNSMKRLKFNPQLTRAEMLTLGDLVYGMYIDNELVKIGKAGGASGFYGRMCTYTNGNPHEATNRKIRRELIERFGDNLPVIQVYAEKTPRVKIEQYCRITNHTLVDYVQTSGSYETYLTALAEIEGADLYLCTQKK